MEKMSKSLSLNLNLVNELTGKLTKKELEISQLTQDLNSGREKYNSYREIGDEKDLENINLKGKIIELEINIKVKYGEKKKSVGSYVSARSRGPLS